MDESTHDLRESIKLNRVQNQKRRSIELIIWLLLSILFALYAFITSSDWQQLKNIYTPAFSDHLKIFVWGDTKPLIVLLSALVFPVLFNAIFTKP